MKKIALALLILLPLAAAFWVALPSDAQAGDPSGPPSKHLLDRGAATLSLPQKGGTTPPAGPTPIFYPPASPSAAPAPPGFGLMGVTAFPPLSGGLVGNLFLPGTPGYPPTFLTAGGVPGFDVTGAYAWHLAPTTMASLARIVGAAAMPPPPTPFATGMIGSAFAFATPSTGFPAPSGIVGGPGVFGTPVRVTTPSVGIYCGLAVGSFGYPPIGAGPAGNGLGGITAAPALPPLRFAPLPFVTGAPVVVLPAPPAAYIAGCFADSSTTPVELQSFHID